MSWGADPDTLSMAIAEGAAERTGHPEGSLEYLKAYRAAYDPVDDAEGNPYLAALDKEITELEKHDPKQSDRVTGEGKS
jgi:lysophospholipase L1-like esterase